MYTKRQNYINKRLSEISPVCAIQNYKQKTESNSIPAVQNIINYFFCIRFLQGYRTLAKICSGAVVYAIRFNVQGSTYAPELNRWRALLYTFRGGYYPRKMQARCFCRRSVAPCYVLYHSRKEKKQGQVKCYAPLLFSSVCGFVCTPLHPNRPRQVSNIITFCALLPGQACAKNYSKGRKGRKGGQGAFALSQHFFRPLLLLSVEKIVSSNYNFYKGVTSAKRPCKNYNYLMSS